MEDNVAEDAVAEENSVGRFERRYDNGFGSGKNVGGSSSGRETR